MTLGSNLFLNGGKHLDSFRGERCSPLCHRRPRPPAFAVSTSLTMQGGKLRRIGRNFAVALALVFGSIIPLPGGVAYAKQKPVTTEKTTKDLRYDGKKELSATDRLISLGLTGGLLGGLMLWAYRKNRKDDELELVRVKEEVDRLEQLRSEFVDVDEDGEVDDEEFFADLNKRLDKPDAEAQEGDEKKDDDNPGSPTGSTAVADPETGVPGDGGAEGGADARDMLKRMFDASDEDKDDEKKDKK